MPLFKYQKKFPWKTLLLGILVVFLVICLFGIVFMGADAFFAFIAGLVVGFAQFVAGIAWACFTSLHFWAGFGIMGAVFFIYFYRKNYAKKTVLTGNTSLGATTSTRDVLAESSIFDEDMKVESA